MDDNCDCIMDVDWLINICLQNLSLNGQESRSYISILLYGHVSYSYYSEGCIAV